MEKMNINITTEYIKLDQLLKFSALAESGAMAKDMIFDGIVSVNGEVCTMRGKKIRPGDKVTVEFEDATCRSRSRSGINVYFLTVPCEFQKLYFRKN